MRHVLHMLMRQSLDHACPSNFCHKGQRLLLNCTPSIQPYGLLLLTELLTQPS